MRLLMTDSRRPTNIRARIGGTLAPFPARTTITDCLPPSLRYQIEAVAVRRASYGTAD